MASVNKKILSGELFDLGVGTLNNKFGKEHIEHIMKYGIYFKLDKFIDELEMIINDDESGSNQKTEKRKLRLNFLKICQQSPVISELFGLFCAHLNGGGDNDDEYQFQKNLLLITVAGGNIFTLFAQLLVNIYEYSLGSTNLMKINDYFLGELEVRLETEDVLQDKNQLASSIVNFIKNGDGTPGLNINTDGEPYLILTTEIFEYINLIAKLPYSDFDFKLSPNISPEDFDINTAIKLVEQATLNGQMGSTLVPDKISDSDPINGSPGFLLLRAKSYVVCNAPKDQIDEKYNPKELNEFKKDCKKYDDLLGIKTQALYPQIMQRQYLDSIDPRSNCYKFLQHLQKKRDLIGDATQSNVNEVVELFNKGIYEKANKDGTLAPQIPKSDTMTEALILYLHSVTKTFNDYLYLWENNRLGINSAPGLNHKSSVLENTEKKHIDKYWEIFKLFATLENLLYGENNLIPRLIADIMINYLNLPNFQTERILDNLLVTYNSNNKNDKCKLAPADIIIAPTNKIFNSGLKKIKEILQDSLYNTFGEIGFPDGLRVTVNAIDTSSFEPTQSQMQAAIPNAEYIPAPRNTTGLGVRGSSTDFIKTSNPPYPGYQGGLSKKTKNKKHKKDKKTKKYKNKKHKKDKKDKKHKQTKKQKKNKNKKDKKHKQTKKQKKNKSKKHKTKKN